MARDDVHSATELTKTGDHAGASVPAAPLLDALIATSGDGATRHLTLGDASERVVEFAVCRDADGRLVLGLVGLPDSETEALRRLARQMAGVTDTSVLLGILCNAAAKQCGANGAGVLKAVANEGELVAAIDALAPARGSRFALPGSLAREVLRTRDVVGYTFLVFVFLFPLVLLLTTVLGHGLPYPL